MTKANSAELIFIVDRSASMASIKEEMETGFRVLIEEQAKLPGACAVSLVRFDHEYEPVYSGMPVKSVPPLKIEPRGNTALLDAIGRTIHETGIRLARMREADRPERVLVVVITDGQENASSTYSHGKVARMVATQRKEFSWAFMFIGADQDAIGIAEGMGIESALNFESKTRGSTRAAYAATSSSAAQYRSSGRLMDNHQVNAVYNANLPSVAGTIDPAAPQAVPVIVVNVATIPGAVKPDGST